MNWATGRNPRCWYREEDTRWTFDCRQQGVKPARGKPTSERSVLIHHWRCVVSLWCVLEWHTHILITHCPSLPQKYGRVSFYWSFLIMYLEYFPSVWINTSEKWLTVSGIDASFRCFILKSPERHIFLCTWVSASPAITSLINPLSHPPASSTSPHPATRHSEPPPPCTHTHACTWHLHLHTFHFSIMQHISCIITNEPANVKQHMEQPVVLLKVP